MQAINEARDRLCSISEAFAELHGLRDYVTEVRSCKVSSVSYALSSFLFTQIATRNPDMHTNALLNIAMQQDDTEHIAILETFMDLCSAKSRLLALRGRHAKLLVSFLLWVSVNL